MPGEVDLSNYIHRADPRVLSTFTPKQADTISKKKTHRPKSAKETRLCESTNNEHTLGLNPIIKSRHQRRKRASTK
eukprot:5882385-Karenia_brevis.AAC.1